MSIVFAGSAGILACNVALRGVKAFASNEVEFTTSLFERSRVQQAEDAGAPGENNLYLLAEYFFKEHNQAENHRCDRWVIK